MLNSYKKIIVNKYEELSPREQTLVLICGIFLITAFIYFFIYEPLNNSVQSKISQVNSQAQTLQYMKNAEIILKNAKVGKAITKETIIPAALLATLDSAIQQASLKSFVTTFNQSANNQVNIAFKQVPFDSIISFLTLIWQKYQIKVVSISITKGNAVGLVNITMSVGL